MRLISQTAPIKAELRQLLEHASRKGKRTRFHRVFANNLIKICPALWTFITVDGIQSTNNAAERALRGPVIYRKLSHGTRSDDGERFIERALSAGGRPYPVTAYIEDVLPLQCAQRFPDH